MVAGGGVRGKGGRPLQRASWCLLKCGALIIFLQTPGPVPFQSSDCKYSPGVVYMKPSRGRSAERRKRKAEEASQAGRGELSQKRRSHRLKLRAGGSDQRCRYARWWRAPPSPLVAGLPRACCGRSDCLAGELAYSVRAWLVLQNDLGLFFFSLRRF